MLNGLEQFRTTKLCDLLSRLLIIALVVVCLFLSPLASIIPSCATAPALIFVGVLMAKNFAKVDMEDMGSAVPAFLALLMMPLTYSISNGIGLGAIAYACLIQLRQELSEREVFVYSYRRGKGDYP